MSPESYNVWGGAGGLRGAFNQRVAPILASCCRLWPQSRGIGTFPLKSGARSTKGAALGVLLAPELLGGRVDVLSLPEWHSIGTKEK